MHFLLSFRNPLGSSLASVLMTSEDGHSLQPAPRTSLSSVVVDVTLPQLPSTIDGGNPSVNPGPLTISNQKEVSSKTDLGVHDPPSTSSHGTSYEMPILVSISESCDWLFFKIGPQFWCVCENAGLIDIFWNIFVKKQHILKCCYM